MDSPLCPALPTSAPPTSTTDGFILANSTGLALVTATNKLHVTDGTEGWKEVTTLKSIRVMRSRMPIAYCQKDLTMHAMAAVSRAQRMKT